MAGNRNSIPRIPDRRSEFESAKRHLLGLKIDNQQGEGTGTISLYFDHEVPDELKAIFIEYAHRHLARYACDVTRDRATSARTAASG